MRIALIAAMATNRVIGVDNKMPWHLSADLKYFKAKTLGKPMICGRKTFESTGRLPGRPNIVVSRSWQAPAPPVNDPCNTVYCARTVPAAIELAKSLANAHLPDCDEIMISGGGQIYTAALPIADRIYLTTVNTAVDGDALFPPMNDEQWQQTSSEAHTPDEKNPYAYTWTVFDRIIP